MASSGWQGDVTLQSNGFGYDYFKGNLRIDSISHVGDTVTVSGVFAVHNTSGYSAYYVFPINAAVNGLTNYQQVVAGNRQIASGEYVESAVTFSFSAGASVTSASIEVLWSYNNGTASNSITYTLYFDASISPPTGLNVSDIAAGRDYIEATVSISGWGIGSGTRYRELQVWSGNMTGDRRYQPVTGGTLSGRITCNNSSEGALTIKPNTKYWIGGYASNGSANTGSQYFSTAITRIPNIEASISSTTSNSITFNWSIPDQGGERDIMVHYSLDSGAWITADTVSGSGVKSGEYSIEELVPNTAYTVKARGMAVGGSDSVPATLSAETLPAEPIFELSYATRNAIVVGYLVEEQGGSDTIYLEYKADGTNEWVVGATISEAGTFSGAIAISGLASNTSYTYAVRARSSGGWTSTPETITATTGDIATKMYCSVNGEATKVKRLYCSVNGTAKKVKYIYGSVNGVARLVYEEDTV